MQLMPETLYLTCNLIDRYLAHNNVARKRLQLVSLTPHDPSRTADACLVLTCSSTCAGWRDSYADCLQVRGDLGARSAGLCVHLRQGLHQVKHVHLCSPSTPDLSRISSTCGSNIAIIPIDTLKQKVPKCIAPVSLLCCGPWQRVLQRVTVQYCSCVIQVRALLRLQPSRTMMPPGLGLYSRVQGTSLSA